MPATRTGKSREPYVLGVDGCRAGWAVTRLNLYDNACSGFVVGSFDQLFGDAQDAAMIIVDMPIGLADAGKRACETKARELLRPHRHASVFSSPRRPMLDFDTYEDANAWGKAQGPGGGLSKQAWMITPKIREIDRTIMPADQKRLGEGHPEVAFHRLNNGAPCVHPKRTEDGQRERRKLLFAAGLTSADALYETLRHEVGRKNIGRDDVFDACALALTAKARLDGAAIRLTDGARDARGLVMEIWG
ncbi:MAG: DUF429 domain-containing protein [Pseudomonadota bacterium]